MNMSGHCSQLLMAADVVLSGSCTATLMHDSLGRAAGTHGRPAHPAEPRPLWRTPSSTTSLPVVHNEPSFASEMQNGSGCGTMWR